MERRCDLAAAEARAVVTLDEERDATATVDVACPSERVVEFIEFLVEELVLLQWRDRLGTARSAICPVGHEGSPIIGPSRVSATFSSGARTPALGRKRSPAQRVPPRLQPDKMSASPTSQADCA